MIAAERDDAILRELRLRGTLTIKEFSERIGVSAITLRRDLGRLESEQKLVRVHGGARVLRRQQTGEPSADRPRAAAKPGSVRGSSSDPPIATLGMIVPTNGYYYAELIEGAKAAAALADVRLTLAISGYQASKELELLDRMINLGLDSILITPAERALSPQMHAAIEHSPVPVIVVERAWQHPTGCQAVDSVRSDHAHGAELAVRHLAGLGHRDVALWTMHNPHHQEILEGFRSTADATGCRQVTAQFGFDHPDWKPHDLPANARRYLTEIRDLGATALLVYPDDFALTVAESARAIGVDIPTELSLIAYDDEIAELAELPLTAVAPPKRAIGFAAIDASLRRLAHTAPLATPFPAQRIRLLPDLHVRDSTAPPLAVASVDPSEPQGSRDDHF